jgi:hypothetical protein
MLELIKNRNRQVVLFCKHLSPILLALHFLGNKKKNRNIIVPLDRFMF